MADDVLRPALESPVGPAAAADGPLLPAGLGAAGTASVGAMTASSTTASSSSRAKRGIPDRGAAASLPGPGRADQMPAKARRHFSPAAIDLDGAPRKCPPRPIVAQVDRSTDVANVLTPGPASP